MELYHDDMKPPDEELCKTFEAKMDEAAVAIANITKDAMDAASMIPYVKGIAGVVGQLLRIRLKLDAHKRRSVELQNKVFSRAGNVLKEILALKEYAGDGDLEGLSRQLKRYLGMLTEVARTLRNIHNRTFFQRFTNRGIDELEALDRKVTEYNEDIIFTEIVQLRRFLKKNIQPQALDGDGPRVIPADNEPMLPPPPVAGMRERDEQRDTIIKLLLDSPTAKVAILGMMGIGKTTLACEVMKHPQIRQAYPRRYFVSFEGLTTIELVYTAFATALSIPIEERNNNIWSTIDRYLREGKTLLCCDNFESFWEPADSTRTAAENFLGSFSADSFPSLSILVTLRGSQRPNRVDWAKPLLPALSPLTLGGAEKVLSHITGQDMDNSGPALELLKAMEGLPLAVTLIANLLRDDNMTADELWGRWCSEHTKAIENETHDRQSNLDISIEISISSPRMTSAPNARLVLAALAILPDGLSDDAEWLLAFQKLLPESINLQDAIRTLRMTSLVTFDKSTSVPRLRLLSPIRHFCLNRLSSLKDDVIPALITLYIKDERMNNDFSSHVSYSWYLREITNIKALLEFALKSGASNDGLGRACRVYTTWCFSYDPIEKGWCLNYLGELYRLSSRFSEAVEPLKEALELHKQAGCVEGEAEDLLEIGQCYGHLGILDESIAALKRSLEIYRELQSPLKEGKVLAQLADSYLDDNELDLAASTSDQALSLFLECSNVLGQADTHQTLGRIDTDRQRFEEAVEHFRKAFDLSKEIKYLLGQYNALRGLGDLNVEAKDPGQAALYYEQSLTFAEKMGVEDYIARDKEDIQRIRSQLLAAEQEKIGDSTSLLDQ